MSMMHNNTKKSLLTMLICMLCISSLMIQASARGQVMKNIATSGRSKAIRPGQRMSHIESLLAKSQESHLAEFPKMVLLKDKKLRKARKAMVLASEQFSFPHWFTRYYNSENGNFNMNGEDPESVPTPNIDMEQWEEAAQAVNQKNQQARAQAKAKPAVQPAAPANQPAQNQQQPIMAPPVSPIQVPNPAALNPKVAKPTPPQQPIAPTPAQGAQPRQQATPQGAGVPPVNPNVNAVQA